MEPLDRPQRANAAATSVLPEKLEVIFQDTSLFPDTCFQRWSEVKGGAAA